MTRRPKAEPLAVKKLTQNTVPAKKQRTGHHKRANSATQKKNAQKLLSAMFDEANKFGLDNLRSARVAAVAGLTTGAIYSRYENADEMLIALGRNGSLHPSCRTFATLCSMCRVSIQPSTQCC